MTGDWSQIGENVVSMVAGAVGIWAALVRPYSARLKEATSQLEEFRLARVTERLDEHEANLRNLHAQHIDCVTSKIPGFATKADLHLSEQHRDRTLNALSSKLDDHARILERLDERTKSTNGWLEKVDDRLEDVSQGLANIAGRQGV